MHVHKWQYGRTAAAAFALYWYTSTVTRACQILPILSHEQQHQQQQQQQQQQRQRDQLLTKGAITRTKTTRTTNIAGRRRKISKWVPLPLKVINR